jgi:hypothetical protein
LLFAFRYKCDGYTIENGNILDNNVNGLNVDEFLEGEMNNSGCTWTVGIIRKFGIARGFKRTRPLIRYISTMRTTHSFKLNATIENGNILDNNVNGLNVDEFLEGEMNNSAQLY